MIKLPCVDEFAHFSGDHKSMHSTLQQLLNIKIAVSHVKVLIGKNKAYKGELIANIEVGVLPIILNIKIYTQSHSIWFCH